MTGRGLGVAKARDGWVDPTNSGWPLNPPSRSVPGGRHLGGLQAVIPPMIAIPYTQVAVFPIEQGVQTLVAL